MSPIDEATCEIYKDYREMYKNYKNLTTEEKQIFLALRLIVNSCYGRIKDNMYEQHNRII